MLGPTRFRIRRLRGEAHMSTDDHRQPPKLVNRSGAAHRGASFATPFLDLYCAAGKPCTLRITKRITEPAAMMFRLKPGRDRRVRCIRLFGDHRVTAAVALS